MFFSRLVEGGWTAFHQVVMTARKSWNPAKHQAKSANMVQFKRTVQVVQRNRRDRRK